MIDYIMHYIYLGPPRADIIQRALTLLERQADPDRSLCGHPRGIFWTFNEARRLEAVKIKRALQHSSHPNVHLDIFDALFALKNLKAVRKYQTPSRAVSKAPLLSEAEMREFSRRVYKWFLHIFKH